MPSLPPSHIRLWLKRLLRGLILVAVAGFVMVALGNLYVVTTNAGRLYSDAALVPAHDVGLVLGTSKTLPSGRPNLHFAYRMDAAAELYRTGKVKHLLVSGDHHLAKYDEPHMMTLALVARGVPESAITRDDSGFRTLDSVVRAKKIYGLSDCVIITQRFHNSRALEIAHAAGIDAVGFCAKSPGLHDSIIPECREIGARCLALVDLYILRRSPPHLGPPQPIVLANR